MEIDNKIYQEAMEVLRTKLSNTSAEMIFFEKYTHQQQWYLQGMIQGLQIGYIILRDLQYNKVYPGFKEKKKPVEDWEKVYREIVGKLGDVLGD